ncbi:MAG: hypothetical protein KDE54_13690 [Caldilineaceae bacterium]|nr:hypothetical protein [Caldilineaceae bacterium]MCB0094718.1 hypothetical protein [Caldilineaceae bacterium]MCB0139248.1 hypothetical protein [Caldilineaceae bacterium]
MNCETLGVHVQRFLDVKHNQSTRIWYVTYLTPMVRFLGADHPLKTVSRLEAEQY